MQSLNSHRLALALAAIISCGLCATAQARPAKRTYRYTVTEHVKRIETRALVSVRGWAGRSTALAGGPPVPPAATLATRNPWCGI